MFTTINTSGGKGIADLLFSSHSALIDSFTVFERESIGGSDYRLLVWKWNTQGIPTILTGKRWNLARTTSLNCT